MLDNDDYLEGLADGFIYFANPTTLGGRICYFIIAAVAIWYFW